MGIYSEFKRRGNDYYYDWIFRKNRNLLQHYLDDVWHPLQHESIIEMFEQKPYIGFEVLRDFDTNMNDLNTNYYRLLDIIKQPGCEVIIISGSKRSGKTYDGWRLLYSLKDEYDVYWVGPPVNIPDWCKQVPDISYLPQGAVGLIDEAAVFLNARRSQSKESVNLLDYIPTMAHAGIKCIFITQFTSRSDIGLVTWADVHIKKQYENVYKQALERGVVNDEFDYFFEPPSKQWSYVKSSSFTGMYNGFNLPWYSDTISKPFTHFESDQQATDYADVLIRADYTPRAIHLNMKLKGYNKSEEYWKKEIGTYER